MFSLFNQITDLNHSQESATISQMLKLLADWQDENMVGCKNVVGTKVQKITEELSFVLQFEFHNR